MPCTSSAEEDVRQKASMPAPAEVFVMFWIFGMLVLAALAIFAVKRLFERQGKKGEKKDGGNGEIGLLRAAAPEHRPGRIWTCTRDVLQPGIRQEWSWKAQAFQLLVS